MRPGVPICISSQIPSLKMCATCRSSVGSAPGYSQAPGLWGLILCFIYTFPSSYLSLSQSKTQLDRPVTWSSGESSVPVLPYYLFFATRRTTTSPCHSIRLAYLGDPHHQGYILLSHPRLHPETASRRTITLHPCRVLQSVVAAMLTYRSQVESFPAFDEKERVDNSTRFIHDDLPYEHRSHRPARRCHT